MLGFSITDPSNSLEWMIFLAKKYSGMFLEGTWLTLYIAVAGTILGFLLGYIIGIIQDIRINEGDSILKKGIFKILKAICRIYVEVFRDTPMIVQAMVIYYGSSTVFGEGRRLGHGNVTYEDYDLCSTSAGLQKHHP